MLLYTWKRDSLILIKQGKIRVTVSQLINMTDLNLSLQYELNFQVLTQKKSSVQHRFFSSSSILFLCFLRSHLCIDLPTCVYRYIHYCTSTRTNLIAAKHKILLFQFLSHRSLQTMVRKGRRRDLQPLILGTYFRDLSLRTSLSSQRRERGSHTPFNMHSICFCSKPLLAVITIIFEFIFQKLMSIYHLSCYC